MNREIKTEEEGRVSPRRDIDEEKWNKKKLKEGSKGKNENLERGKEGVRKTGRKMLRNRRGKRRN